MTLATHSLTGAVIGKNIESPWLVIIISLVFHYVLDYFKHGEYLNCNSQWKDFWKVFIDLLAGSVVIWAIINLRNISSAVQFNIFLGAFFSMIPDFLTLLYWKLGIKFLKPLYELHLWAHKYPPFSPERDLNFRNAVNDIVISVIAIILLVI